MIIAALLFLVSSVGFGGVAVTWEGDFLTENHFMRNFDMSNPCSGGQNCDPGYSIGYVNRGYGQDRSSFTNLRLRLAPGILVNDNIQVNSRFVAGNYFLGGSPGTAGTSGFTSRGIGSNGLNVDQLFAELRFDFGKFQIGRAPRHWGMGGYWNSGAKSTDRFSDIQDSLSFFTRLGPIQANIGLGKVVEGRLVGSSQEASPSTGTNAQIPYRGGAGTETVGGSDNLFDYFASLVYDWEALGATLGVKVNKRKGGTHQTSYLSQSSYDPATGQTTLVRGLHNKIDYIVADIYFNKDWSDKFGTRHEAIVVEGEIGNNDADSRTVNGKNEQSPDKYSSFAWISENYWRPSSKWKVGLDLGYVPGQPSQPLSNETNRYKAVFLSPSYQKGMLMFGRNFNNLGSAASSDQAAYDNVFNVSISNARYIAPRVDFQPSESWSVYALMLLAKADTRAVTGSRYYDHRRGNYFFAQENQQQFLGFEVNMGTGYQWNDQTQLLFDAAVWQPGDFYKFDNRFGQADPATDIVWGTQVRLAVQF